MSLFDIVEGVLKSVQSDFRSLSSEVFSSIDYVIEDSLNMASSSSLDVGFETIKEVAFGGAIGLCAGYAAKKAGAPVLIGVASASFFLLRGAIFDGHIQASWSPLAIDDASFARHMQRKIRRETLSGQQRFDKFIEQNGVLLLSFGSGAFIGQIGS